MLGLDKFEMKPPNDKGKKKAEKKKSDGNITSLGERKYVTRSSPIKNATGSKLQNEKAKPKPPTITEIEGMNHSDCERTYITRSSPNKDTQGGKEPQEEKTTPLRPIFPKSEGLNQDDRIQKISDIGSHTQSSSRSHCEYNNMDGHLHCFVKHIKTTTSSISRSSQGSE
jgi:hypothetical protein